ncbi:MAG TPA: SCO family protein [Gammaproteobacteria bacterium]
MLNPVVDMRNRLRRRIAGGIAVVCVATTGFAITASETDSPKRMSDPVDLSLMNAHCLTAPTPETAADYKKSLRRYHIPDIVLTDMNNADAQAAQVLNSDGPIMLNFIFTTCNTICPVLSTTFAQVRTLLGPEADRIRFVSITIDPEQDTPAILGRYAQKYQAATGWGFFTGQRNDIISLQRAFDIYRGNKMSHVPAVFLRTRGDAQWLRIEGFPTAQELVIEYRALVDRSITETNG